MKKKIAAAILAVMVSVTALAGCGTKENKEPASSSDLSVSAETQEQSDQTADTGAAILEDGTYSVNVELQGGSGRATVESTATVTVTDGQAMATIVWSSTHYDYMIVDGEKYLNENEGGNSTFTFPISGVPCDLDVIGDTTAMSTPHEIEYTLIFSFPENVSFNDLNCEGRMNLAYADQFSVEQYGAYKLITIVDSGRYLLVPQGVSVPTDVPSDVVVLQQPLTDGYLVSSAVMDLVCKTGALSNIKFTGLKEKDWYVQEAADAMKAGDLVYAGKYSAPDYELLLGQGCKFAIENSMILHNPEVKEKLEELGIPVLIERSSYEKHPLGRLEWIRLFGVLFNQEQAGTDFFRAQVERVQPILEKENTGRTVAFFAVSSDGTITVRKPNDYVSSMIDLAGGVYSLNGYIEEEENALSTLKMQMEDFYVAEKDADILIYNGTIEGELNSIDELIAKNNLFADFKAVKSGDVYTTGSNFYQETSATCDFIEDLNKILTNSSDTDYRFIRKLQ